MLDLFHYYKARCSEPQILSSLSFLCELKIFLLFHIFSFPSILFAFWACFFIFPLFFSSRISFPYFIFYLCPIFFHSFFLSPAPLEKYGYQAACTSVSLSLSNWHLSLFIMSFLLFPLLHASIIRITPSISPFPSAQYGDITLHSDTQLAVTAGFFLTEHFAPLY